MEYHAAECLITILKKEAITIHLYAYLNYDQLSGGHNERQQWQSLHINLCKC